MKKRLFLLSTASIIGLSTIFGLADNKSTLNNKIKNYENVINQNKDKIKNLEDNILKIDNEKSETLQQVYNIERNINDIQANINTQSDQIDLINKKLEENNQKLEKLNNEYQKSYAQFEEQLISSYVSSYSPTYGKVLTESETLSDFIISNTYFEYVIDDKNDQLENINKIKVEQTKVIEDIKNDKIKVEVAMNEMNESKIALESEQSKYAIKLNEIESQKEQLEEVLDAEYIESKNAENQIYKLQKELYDLEGKNSPSKPDYSSTPRSNGGYIYPLDNQFRRVTSSFGWRVHPISNTKKYHSGIDVGIPSGSKLYAVKDGTVIYAGWMGGYGYSVVIDHGGYISSQCAHMSSISVEVGQEVSQGQIIGRTGNTGNSTGPHLHFEIKYKGKAVNPTNYINF